MSKDEKTLAQVNAEALLLKVKQREELIQKVKGYPSGQRLWMQFAAGALFLLLAFYESHDSRSSLLTLVIGLSFFINANFSAADQRLNALLELVLSMEKENDAIE